MSTTIVNQFGRPYPYAGASAQRYKGSEDDRYRLARPRLDDDMARLLSREKFRMLLADTRWIAETFPLIKGMVRQKREYISAAGWLPEFTGADEAFGAIATPALHAALGIADVRGMFGWDQLWETATGLCDIDGASFELFTRTESGLPQSQFLEAHRVGQRSPVGIVGPDDATTVLDDGRSVRGAYAGLSILNGIIYNPAGREVAYRVLGATPADDRDISARDMQHVCDPEWFSEGRPFPSIACAILDWYDVKEAREFQRVKQKMNSAIMATESNATGEAPADTPGPDTGLVPPRAAPTDGGPTYQVLAGGLIRYLKAGSGELKIHTANDPSDGWRAFDHAVISGAFYGAGWHIGLMDASELGRSPIYAVQDWINTTIVRRHSRIKRFALRSARRTLAILIQRGEVPRHPEWASWDIPAPPEFSVDSGRAQQADRDNTTFGLDSEPAVIRRTTGRDYRRVLNERARFVRDRNAIAKEYGLKPEDLAFPFKPGQQAASSFNVETPPADNSAGT